MTAAREHNVVGLESPAGFRTFRLLEGGIETSEADVIVVSSHANPRGGVRKDLYDRIESLHGRIEAWMVYHLHVLRVCGNEGAHLRAGRPPLRDADVPALLVSLLRVILWWEDRCSAAGR